MGTIGKDVRHAWRSFRDNPVFTATAVLALTLGIGVNVAIFSVVNAVLLKPIPYDSPDTLVMPMNTNDGAIAGPAASPAKFVHWRAQSDVLENVAAFRTISMNFARGDVLESVPVHQVSAEFFAAFRPPLLAGRAFTPAEDLPNAGRTVVVGENFWRQRLGADPNLVGQSITLSGNPYTVVGVMARGFEFRDFGQADLWVPFQLDPNTTDQGHYFATVGRLKAGVTLEQAQARLAASAAPYRERFPPAMGPKSGFSVLSYQEAIVGQARNTLFVALGAVGFVLLIACANVANLLLIRATGRRREMAVRVALGAGRWRIVRQLLTESVLLALIGGVLGVVVGYVGMRLLLTVNTAGLPRLGDSGSLLGIDWRVALFGLGVSLFTGLLFGLIPALVASQADLNSVIKDSSGRSGSGLRQNKTRSALVLVEVSLAVVLLVGAALLIRTSYALGNVDPGFQARNVLTMRTSLSAAQFRTSEAVDQTARAVLERIREIPGVAAAAMTCCVPLQGGYGLPFNVVGRVNEGPFTGGGGIVYGTPGYFDAFNIPVVRGRAFDDRDTASAPPVVVVNQAFVKQYFKQGDPLGERILIGGGAANMKELATEPIREIVGVVGDVRAGGIGNDPGPMMYMPQAQEPDGLNALMQAAGAMAWIVRTNVPPETVSATVQNLVRQATGVPVTGVQNMSDIVSVSISRQRLNMLLMTTFGAAALALAAIGIYGLMAYSVQQRTQEIGIRLALGALPNRVRASVVAQGMILVGIGVAAGVVAAFFLARLLASVLFGVAAHDTLVFVGVPLVLGATAFAAVAIAAQRASRVDPLDALRYE
ncbi:MAG TPA: ABC transporter permease [Gammaproteobacteria bacterium]|nr:ABC transporter permease [Gammaproteobacteria bacterium]